MGEPIGVQLIELADEESNPNRLRYERPTVDDLDVVDWKKDIFNESQLVFLVNNLPDGSPELTKAEEAFLEA